MTCYLIIQDMFEMGEIAACVFVARAQTQGLFEMLKSLGEALLLAYAGT